MKIEQKTRQVTDYTFTLSEEALHAALSDPIAWADGVRAELNYTAPLTPPPAAKVARHSRNGKKGGAGKTPAKGAGAGAKGPKASGRKPAPEGLACSVCGKSFKNQGWLTNHMAKVHSTVVAYPTPATSTTSEA